MPGTKKPPFNFSLTIDTRDESTGEVLQEQQTETLCIAMMGDFSGRGDEVTGADIASQSFIEIDRYNFDEVLASMKLNLSLALNDDGGDVIEVPINSLKDFHPDNLYANVPVFAQLEALKKQLHESAANGETAMESASPPAAAEPENRAASEQAPASASAVPEDNLLDAIMDATEDRQRQPQTPQAATRTRKAPSPIDAFVSRLVADRKTVVRELPPSQAEAGVDEAIAEQMRRLLHHPRFQALESAWRAVYFMVRRIRSGKAVKLYLLDVGKAAVSADLGKEDVTRSALYSLFCDTSKGDINWNLIVGDYRFGTDIDDLLLLSALGMIAKHAGSRFFAAADEKLVGCESFARTPKPGQWQYDAGAAISRGWNMLRKSPVADSISLALPRFLLREPYGGKNARVKSFTFEEMNAGPAHDEYLWGNPAFLKAEQLARAFIESGAAMRLDNVLETGDLPVHYYEEGGQTMVMPCAEIALTDDGAAKMLAQGLIPLWSIKNTDRVHSGDFHSINA